MLILMTSALVAQEFLTRLICDAGARRRDLLIRQHGEDLQWNRWWLDRGALRVRGSADGTRHPVPTVPGHPFTAASFRWIFE